MKKEVFYISNLLSILRIVLLIPLSYLLIFKYQEYSSLIAGLILFMGFTDILDGYTARKFNQVSELGKVIDPIADKVSFITIAIILVFKGLIPYWFLAVIILRDVLIVIFGLVLRKKIKITLMSNYPGKIAALSIGIILLFSAINNELLKTINSYLYYVSVILILYSSYLYYSRYKKTIGEQKNA